MVTIAEYAVIGAGTVVASDVLPRSLVIGNPVCVTKPIGELTYSTGIPLRDTLITPMAASRNQDDASWGPGEHADEGLQGGHHRGGLRDAPVFRLDDRAERNVPLVDVDHHPKLAVQIIAEEALPAVA